MSSIDNGVMGLIGGNPTAAKGKAAEGGVDGKSLARSSEFAEAFASVAGRSGDQHGYRFKARGADAEGQDGENEGRGSKRLQSGFESAERSLLNGRVTAEGGGKHAAGETDDPAGDGGKVEQGGGSKRKGTVPAIDAVVGAVGTKPAGKDGHAADGAKADRDAQEDGAGDAGTSETADVGVLLSLLSGAEQAQGQVMAAQGETAQRSATKSGSGDKRGDGRKEAVGQVSAGERAAARLAATDPAAGADMAEIGPDISDADQVFRLIRADGKGREVELSIGRGEAGGVNETANQAVRAETVTVLDARRYLGLADVGNSAAVTAAISQDREWASALTASSALGGENALTGKVVNTLKIQMQPIDLGTVTATLRLSGEELVVDLQVETGEAYRQLSDDKDQIVKALRGHGFAVEQVNVQLSPVDRSSGTSQGGAQPQFSGQQHAHEGGNGRQGGGQQPSGDWNGFAAGEGLGNEQFSANSGVAGSQPARAGGVYL